MRGRMRAALAALALSLGLIGSGSPSLAAVRPVKAAPASKPAAKPAPKPASQAITQMAGQVIASGDNRGLPFAIIDKVAAQVAVFDAAGKPRGVGPALLGLTPGDDATPGIGDREMSDIPPEERTTPAGRFLAGFAPGADQRKVLWVDYATAISLHPVVTTKPKERRPQRLRSVTADDNRISYGCINVTAAFYTNVVRRTFAKGGGMVYILPEVKTLAEVFPAIEAWTAANSAPTGEPVESAHASQTASAATSDVPLVK
jgi:hypothetical protein